MLWLAGPYVAAALLLAVAGAPKVGRPDSTARALASMHLPAARSLVRALGAAEVVIGVVALIAGGRLAAVLVATSYLAFSVLVVLARTRGGVLSSCGCFGGNADTPPTRTHLAVTLASAAVAGTVAVHPVGRLSDVLASTPMAGLPFLAMTALCVWFAYLTLAVLPGAGGRAVALVAGPRRS